MERYDVIAEKVEIHTGILQLDKKQASARVHALDDLGDGLYQVRRTVQFKRGEAFGYDGSVNKAMLRQIAAVKKGRK